MAIVSRTQIAMPTDIVQLNVQFESGGVPVDLDSFPNITVVQPSGNVMFGPTNVGVYRLGVGLYGYDIDIGITGPLGVWTDIWQGTLSGAPLKQTHNFVVYNTQVPAINSDGYIHLGDDPGFNYTQNAMRNINKLIKAVKARLNSGGLSVTKDGYGNTVFHDCDIYTIDQLVTFIATSLTAFNQIPHFTFFTFEDTEIIDNFFEVLVQHAVIYALASKALIERGREFVISDNGLSFQPPTVSELINTQWSTELNSWYDKVQLIKKNMKPQASSLGVFGMNSAINPAFRRLRHLRQRRLI